MLNKTLIILTALLLAACNRIPADPEKTLQKARETGLAVGFSPNPPWVTEEDGEPYGIEGNIIRAFAGKESLKIVWEKGSEQDLLLKLENNELHIVISGLKKDSPWKSRKIGITRPYLKEKKEKHVIAVRQGENRLIRHLENYLFVNKDSIKIMSDEIIKELRVP